MINSFKILSGTSSKLFHQARRNPRRFIYFRLSSTTFINIFFPTQPFSMGAAILIQQNQIIAFAPQAPTSTVLSSLMLQKQRCIYI